MCKELRYIMSSIFMLIICFALVGCKAHESKNYLVDGEEIIGDEIDHIPNNITFKKNASVGTSVTIKASLIPSTAIGNIYCFLGMTNDLSDDDKKYAVENLNQTTTNVNISCLILDKMTSVNIGVISLNDWTNSYYLNFFAVNKDGSFSKCFASCILNLFENVTESIFNLNVKNCSHWSSELKDKVPDGIYKYKASNTSSTADCITIFDYYDSISSFFENSNIYIYLVK